jgi:hypothetical protein
MGQSGAAEEPQLEQRPASASAASGDADLAWLPPTLAAVSLRLAAFDAALIYSPGVPPARDTLQVPIPDLSPGRSLPLFGHALCFPHHPELFCFCFCVLKIPVAYQDSLHLARKRVPVRGVGC